MHCTIEHFLDGRWQPAATVTALGDPASGHQGPCIFEYEPGYAVEHFGRREAMVACAYPVNLEHRCLEQWPPFLLDLLPQCAGRLYLHEAAKRMCAALGLNQRQFARMLGIAERTYIDFERQAGNPTLETLRRIGCAFGFEVKFGPMQTLHDQGEQARTRCTEVKKPTHRSPPSRHQ